MDQNILKILVCPITKEKLTLDKKKNELISKKAKLAYKIKEGIPILLPEEQENYSHFNDILPSDIISEYVSKK